MVRSLRISQQIHEELQPTAFVKFNIRHHRLLQVLRLSSTEAPSSPCQLGIRHCPRLRPLARLQLN
eukprot:scaffold5913_cov34-Prasinocladus_malaysianus.AAC.1